MGYLHLFLAMAMQETTHLDVQQRDDTKDGPAGSEWTKPSANLTIFNMNVVRMACCDDWVLTWHALRSLHLSLSSCP